MGLKPNGLVSIIATAGATLLGVTWHDAPVTGLRQCDGVEMRIDLAAQLAAGRLRPINREVAPLPERAGAVRVSERVGPGVVWIEGVDFTQGTIEMDVRGRDVLQQSFLGIAFHGASDSAYDVVYLRPFNFRATDPVRHQHAVQYAVLPDYDWPRLRKEFPEEFENPVDATVDPTGWVPLRVVVRSGTVRIHVGSAQALTLEVRKLGTLNGGMIGLWVGNTSNGDFANLRVVPAR
jgi:hypothetical protein